MHMFSFVRLASSLLAATFGLLLVAGTAQAQLISHWALDDGSPSQTAADHVNGNTLTLGGAAGIQSTDPAWTTSSKLGPAALDFNRAAGTFADAPDSASFSLTTSVTIAAWVKRDSLSGAREMFLGKGNGASNATQEYWFDFESGNQIGWYLSAAGGSYPTTAATVTDTTVWHHIAGVYDGATQKIYLDGVQVLSVNVAGSLSDTSIPFTLGKGYVPSGEPADVKMDDVGLWKNALSGPKVTALVSLANEPTLKYDLGKADLLFQAYDSLGQVYVAPLLWQYTTGLTTPLGQVTIVGEQYFLRLDASGAGLQLPFVPEPGTMTLLAIGVVGLAVRARRRRKVSRGGVTD